MLCCGQTLAFCDVLVVLFLQPDCPSTLLFFFCFFLYASLIGAHFVVIIGGCSDTSSALDDCYVLNVEESHLKMVSHDYA